MSSGSAGLDPRSIKVKILAGAVLAIVTVMLAFGVYNDRSMSKSRQQDVENAMLDVSATAAAGIGNWFAGRILLIEDAAQSLGSLAPDADMNLALGRPVLDRTFNLTFAGTGDGRFAVWPRSDLSADYDPRKRPWYRNAMAARGTVLSEPYENAVDKRIVISVSTRFVRNGSTAGVVGGDFAIDSVMEVLGEVDLGGSGEAFLVSRDGRILAHRNSALIGKNLKDRYPRTAPAIVSTVSTASDGNHESLVTFARIPGLDSQEWYLGLSVDRDTAFASLGTLRISAAVGMLSAAILTLAILGYLFGRLIARPLEGVTMAMERLAAGDLATEIPTTGRQDEIGRMLRSVAAFKEALVERGSIAEEARVREAKASEERRRAREEMASSFEARIGSLVHELSAASGELEATARTMSSTADETLAKSSAVASSAQQTSATVQTVAAAAEELAMTAQEIGNKVIQSAEIARLALADAQRTDTIVKDLHESSQRIGEVIQVIGKVAGQTNLLALNATIEAARAGPAGKGFAVVATEVKNLSDQTARATQEISSQITRVQAETRQAVEAITCIRTVVAQVHDISSAIAAAVAQQQAATQEIARNVAQAAQGTEEVTVNVEQVRLAATTTGSSAGRVLSSANELARESTELGAEVERFLNGIRSA